MNDNLARAVDAFSASPAIRLRYQILAAKGVSFSETRPGFPPSIDDRVNQDPLLGQMDFAARAAAERHPLAELIRLRQEAADEIERLLTFLDESEGIVGEDVIDDDEDTSGDDLEPSLGAFENLHHDAAWEASPTNASCFVDAELATWDDESSGDDEPDLGWTRTGALGNSSDIEIGEVMP